MAKPGIWAQLHLSPKCVFKHSMFLFSPLSFSLSSLLLSGLSVCMNLLFCLCIQLFCLYSPFSTFLYLKNDLSFCQSFSVHLYISLFSLPCSFCLSVSVSLLFFFPRCVSVSLYVPVFFTHLSLCVSNTFYLFLWDCFSCSSSESLFECVSLWVSLTSLCLHLCQRLKVLKK